ncbi:phosphopantothenate--cysteine ligase [compost metagenome]
MKKNDCDLVWSNDIKRIRESGHQGFIVEKDKVTYCIRKEVIAKNILDVAITYVEKK